MTHSSRPDGALEPFALSIEEGSKYASLGRTKFYELLKDMKIPRRKCGRRTLILRADLEAALKALPQIVGGQHDQD